jgi:3-oxoadipate enol-lactonase
MIKFNYNGSDGCRLTAWKTEPAGNLVTVLLHGGGPDHHSLMPLAYKLSNLTQVIVPDIRGYGVSVCTDPHCHTWQQYAEDVLSLLDHLKADKAVVGGTGLGATISLRFATAYPHRSEAIIPISIEDIEDDEAKKAEIEFMDAFAERVRTGGIMAGWEPILDGLAPAIRTLVEEAIPRSNPESIASAAAIGRDRSFRKVDELKEIWVPALIIPGMDHRHPAALARQITEIMPKGRLADVKMNPKLKTADDLARQFAPAIRKFLIELNF